MWRALHQLMIGLLVLAFSHAPIPWAHCHESLSPEQLVIHLNLYHSSDCSEGMPYGWHVHYLELAQVESCDSATIEDPTERQPQRVGFGAVAVLQSDGLTSRFVISSAGVVGRSDAGYYISQRELFKHYGAFLI